jgi:hypothetical protein
MDSWVRRNKLVWLALSALVAGCSVPHLLPDYSPDAAADLGVAVMSIGRAGATEFDLSTLVRTVGGGRSYVIVVDDDATRQDFGHVEFPPSPNAPGSPWGYAPASDPVQHLVVTVLPAGEYEMTYLAGKSPRFKRSHSSKFILSSDDLGVRFSVKPGRVTYVGSVVFAFPDWLAYSRPMGPLRVVTSDTRARDEKLLLDRYPKIATELPERDVRAPDSSRVFRYYLREMPDGGTSKGM